MEWFNGEERNEKRGRGTEGRGAKQKVKKLEVKGVKMEGRQGMGKGGGKIRSGKMTGNGAYLKRRKSDGTWTESPGTVERKR